MEGTLFVHLVHRLIQAAYQLATFTKSSKGLSQDDAPWDLSLDLQVPYQLGLPWWTKTKRFRGDGTTKLGGSLPASLHMPGGLCSMSVVDINTKWRIQCFL